jgi:hypothetical protein
MTFDDAWGSVVAMREAIAGGYVKPGRDEEQALALADEIDRLRIDALMLDWLLDNALVIHMRHRSPSLMSQDRKGIADAMRGMGAGDGGSCLHNVGIEPHLPAQEQR